MTGCPNLTELDKHYQIILSNNDNIIKKPKFKKFIKSLVCDKSKTVKLATHTRHGGSLKDKTRKAVKLTVIFALAGVIYTISRMSGLMDVDCFAWYSPIVYFMRTPLQNAYCSIVTNVHSQLTTIIQDLFKAHNISALIAAVTAAGTGYYSILKAVKKLNNLIENIVARIFNEKSVVIVINDETLKKEEKTDVDDVLPDEDGEEEEDEDEESKGGAKNIIKTTKKKNINDLKSPRKPSARSAHKKLYK